MVSLIRRPSELSHLQNGEACAGLSLSIRRLDNTRSNEFSLAHPPPDHGHADPEVFHARSDFVIPEVYWLVPSSLASPARLQMSPSRSRRGSEEGVGHGYSLSFFLLIMTPDLHHGNWQRRLSDSWSRQDWMRCRKPRWWLPYRAARRRKRLHAAAATDVGVRMISAQLQAVLVGNHHTQF